MQKLRNVKVHLVLNILIKIMSLKRLLRLLKKRIMNLVLMRLLFKIWGLLLTLIKAFPDLPIHASTQMTVHNLDGVKLLEKLGFLKGLFFQERLGLNEIEYICKNSNIEIETFLFMVLYVCLILVNAYFLVLLVVVLVIVENVLVLADCLMNLLESIESGINKTDNKKHINSTSTYDAFNSDLVNTENIIDKGYLLSTKDLCGLEYLPALVKAGVICFKIEGRMKTPEYVNCFTRIYMKIFR